MDPTPEEQRERHCGQERDDAEDPAAPEGPEVDRALFRAQLVEEQRRDEEAGQGEEDVDAEEPTREVAGVVEHDAQAGNGSQAVQRRGIGEPSGRSGHIFRSSAARGVALRERSGTNRAQRSTGSPFRAARNSRRGIVAASRYSTARSRKPSGGAGSSIRSMRRPWSAMALT